MRVTLTGATGLIGRKLVRALRERGDDVTLLSRSPGSDTVVWDPAQGPAPASALAGRDAVVHLAGENVAQRWSDEVKERILSSRVEGTRNLVAGLRAADPRPRALISASASGYYGPHGAEPIDESAPAGTNFLAEVCVAWEREGDAATELGLRVAHLRTGVVLDRDGGALATMLPPFKLGVGGPVAGGKQYIPWIHADDVKGLYLAALDGDDAWSSAINVSAPTPVTNTTFSKALGRALHRPAFMPVPGAALKVLYGDMAGIVTTGVNMLPARAEELGYAFAYPVLDAALRSALD